MVPPLKKRKLQAPSESARKRPVKKSSTKATGPRQRITDSTALAWQSVGEDFGALQVINGVDIVKDGDKVSFLVGNSAVNHEELQEDDEPFEGFSDNDMSIDEKQGSKEKSNPTKNERAQDGTLKNDAATDKKSSRGKDQLETAQKIRKTKDTVKNSFHALENMAEEDDGDVEKWAALGLSTKILSAIAKLRFSQPTAIQQKSIPEVLAGHDVIGKAQTGSGKTLAFGIPVVERWLELQDEEVERKGPMALVLSPTRELAKQLGDHITALCDGLASAPYVCVVTGGLSIQKQQRQLEKADIVIGTPGRLWEVLDGDIKLQEQFTKIQFLVVDEADRLFKAGQFKEAEHIIGALDGKQPEDEDNSDDDEAGKKFTERQTLVFSATFDKDLQTKLAGKGRPSSTGSDLEKMAYLMKCLKFHTRPKFIDVNPVSQMADGLREGLIECGAMEKDLYLYSVLLLNPGKRSLVFTNSISAVRRIVPFLQNLNLTALPLHSQMIQKARLRSLERFTANKGSILVATDVAARGLDIKEVDLVLHYHVPRSADSYIHRSGRTARGDRTGVSVMLCAPDEVLPTRRLAGKVHAERSGKREHFIETLPLDRKVAARLKPRADIAKRLADSVLAKEKSHGEDKWLRNAAEDLGVDYDSDDFEAAGASGGWKNGRGGGRKKKDKEAASLSKAELGALRAQLREELSRRVNMGVSERYVAGGRVDMAALLRERENNSIGGLFLGGDTALGLGFGYNLE